MSHLYRPIIAAGADQLWPPASWVAGVNKGSVTFQALNPLPCFTVPNAHGLVCACRK